MGRPLALAAWLPAAAARPVPRATLRLAVIAASVSAAKAGLFAVAGSAFLAAYGAQGLPWLYVALAGIAATAALLLAPRLERGCPVRALAGLLAGTAALTLLACALLVGRVAGAAAALLLLSHVYSIAAEILLWVTAAAWLPAPDLRRATVWLYLATALGGFAGGLAIERLLYLGPGVASGVVTLVGCGVAGFWVRRSLAEPGRGSARPPPDAPPDAPPDPGEETGGWREALLAHPLGPLLGACSFMLTLVWGLTEYLCFAVYERQIADPAVLARFLAALYAVQQLLEFACVGLLTGPVTRRMSPLGRSLLFPLGSLATLLALGRGFGITAAMVAHSHAEAVSNGLFDPVHAANFAAVPQRLQARLRSASEGVCYPLGMAAGGLLLIATPGRDDLGLVLALTVGAAVLFAAVAGFAGVMVTPALLAELGLTAELGAAPRRADLRAAERALAPWARRTRLRQRLLGARAGRPGAAVLERRVARANRRALAEAFARAKGCDPAGVLPRLEVLLDSRRLELRAIVAEAVLSLPVRRLFVAFLPALRGSYLG